MSGFSDEIKDLIAAADDELRRADLNMRVLRSVQDLEAALMAFDVRVEVQSHGRATLGLALSWGEPEAAVATVTAAPEPSRDPSSVVVLHEPAAVEMNPAADVGPSVVPDADDAAPVEEFISGAWSDAETATAHRMLDAGEKTGAIARALGRKYDAVSVALSKLRKTRAAAAGVPVEKAPAKMKLVPGKLRADKAAKPVTPVPDASAASLEHGRQFGRIHAHLDSLDPDANWTVQKDLELVSAMAADSGGSRAAVKLGQPLPIVLARWRLLNVFVGDKIHLDRLIVVLRARMVEA